MTTKYKYLLPLAILVLLAAQTASAQSIAAAMVKMKINDYPKYSFGIHTGMDLGAAVPYPLSGMGGESKMSATPKIAPALGLSARMHIDERWSFSLEATYKELGIDAKAWVTDQRFRDKDDPTRIVSFRGSTRINMQFSMLEIPVYASYDFFGGNSRVLAGVYYSQVFGHQFQAVPTKGIVTSITNPGELPTMVTPDSPYNQIFDNDLSSWDFGFLVGYEWTIFQRLNLGVRLDVGLKDIFKKGNNFLSYKMLHMRGSVVLGYQIFRTN